MRARERQFAKLSFLQMPRACGLGPRQTREIRERLDSRSQSSDLTTVTTPCTPLTVLVSTRQDAPPTSPPIQGSYRPSLSDTPLLSNMSDTEDSRAASLGRKRNHNPDVIRSARDAEKRRKLDSNANFVALDSDDNSETVSEDRESGEVSSVSGSHHSAGPGENNDAFGDARPRPQARSEQQAPHTSESAPTRSKGSGEMVLEAIYPDSFQKFVREQLEEPNGLDSIGAVLAEYNQTNKPYRKYASEFLQDFSNGYQKWLGDHDFLELQRLVKDETAFRKPLDIHDTASKKASSKSTAAKDQEFLVALQKACEKAPWKPRAEVAFDLMMFHKTHTKACRVLKKHIDENLIPGKDRPNAVLENTKAEESADDDNDIQDDKPEVRNNIHLSELSKDELKEQAVYFNLHNPSDLVRCLSCGDRGHKQPSCPAHQCSHCRSKSHFSRTCPSHQKCTRCRQRGHRSAQCSRGSKLAGSIGDECDICGERGHAEEECSGIWTTFKPTRANVALVAEEEMVVSCYNCGRATHWGDDCPALPDFVADFITFDTWSDKNARRYILGRADVGGEHNGAASVGQYHENGRGMPAHQVAMLGEWA